MKKIIKINENGELISLNTRLGIFELTSGPWSWADITKGYLRESKKNYKNNYK